MIQKAIPAKPWNLNEECNAIMNGAAKPSNTWMSSQWREFPCRASHGQRLRNGYRKMAREHGEAQEPELETDASTRPEHMVLRGKRTVDTDSTCSNRIRR